MSTRAIVGALRKGGWEGALHLFDSEPAELGRRLLDHMWSVGAKATLESVLSHNAWRHWPDGPSADLDDEGPVELDPSSDVHYAYIFSEDDGTIQLVRPRPSERRFELLESIPLDATGRPTRRGFRPVSASSPRNIVRAVEAADSLEDLLGAFRAHSRDLPEHGLGLGALPARFVVSRAEKLALPPAIRKKVVARDGDRYLRVDMGPGVITYSIEQWPPD